MNIVATLQGAAGRGHRIDAEAASGGHLVVAHALTARTQKSGDPTTDTFVTGLKSESQRRAVRRLTPTECERLQGFPDRWTLLPAQLDANENNPKPDAHRYAQMGNAVTVNVAEWIGHRIMAHVEPAAAA